MKTVYWLAALVAAGLGMGAVNASATSLTWNSTTVLSDDYETGTPGSTPTPEVGTWRTGLTFGRPEAVVTNAASPGPFQGSNYLDMDNSAYVGTSGPAPYSAATVDIGALSIGDTLHWQTEFYIPSSSYTQAYPWQIELAAFNSSYSAAQTGGTLLNFYPNTPGSWASSSAFIGPTGYSHDVWQQWDLNYTVGASTATITIAGTNATIPVSSTSVLSGQTYSLTIFSNRATAHFYLDAVPEPSTWTLLTLGTGALGLVVRRQRRAA